MKTSEPKPTKEEILKNAIYDKIKEDLIAARLNSWETDDGDKYPLLDHLSKGENIDSGILEIDNIVDQIEIDELLIQYAEAYHKEKLKEELSDAFHYGRNTTISFKDYLKTKE